MTLIIVRKDWSLLREIFNLIIIPKAHTFILLLIKNAASETETLALETVISHPDKKMIELTRVYKDWSKAPQQDNERVSVSKNIAAGALVVLQSQRNEMQRGWELLLGRVPEWFFFPNSGQQA